MLEPEGPAPGSWRPQAAELEWGGERRGDVEGARLAPVAHRTSGTGAAVLQGVVEWRAPWPLCACSLHWIRWSRQTRAPDDWGLSAPTRRKPRTPHAARRTSGDLESSLPRSRNRCPSRLKRLRSHGSGISLQAAGHPGDQGKAHHSHLHPQSSLDSRSASCCVRIGLQTRHAARESTGSWLPLSALL